MTMKKRYRYDLHKDYLELEALRDMIEPYLEEGNFEGCKPYQKRYDELVDAIDRGEGERGLYEQ